MRRRRTMRVLAATAALAVALAGCGDDDDDDAATGDETTTTAAQAAGVELPTLEVGASEYKFDVPASVESGPTRLVLENTGKEAHHAQLFKLKDGATIEQLGEKLATGSLPAMLEVGAFEGGTGTVDPGGTATAVGIPALTAGTYAFLCFIEGADEAPHLAKGMIQPMTVTAAAEEAEAPESDGEIRLVDYTFEGVDALKGDGTYDVKNAAATEGHEMNMMRLQDGATQQDVIDFFGGQAQGPPKFSSVGGMQALLPNGSQQLSLDVEPGNYVFLCFVPSPDGTPHVQKGMIKQVAIT